ncbi:MAG: L-threonylcarbamoyladenylate synthase [Candidatus Omnitrophica bacterium]|nr:L-threonylcarbamoyladenylate synthase [Candidatus Omnitrophota bacterium]MCM8806436.1 L-threonylcarbamoyladenylate synthase [Candidatus Omnitrophota bacterium]
MAQILKPEKKNIELAANILKSGGVIAFPTETVYGLGANGLNPISVAKIFEIKNRPFFDPVILHICRKDDIKKLWKKIDERAEKLIEKFWPGPLTIILPKTEIVPYIVTAGLETVAIRMPSHPVALEILKEVDFPVAAPSANLFGRLSPTTPEHVNKQIGNKIEIIIDGGKCPIGIESTVLDLTTEKNIILRPGGLPKEEIEKVIGKVEFAEKTNHISSPGQLPSHYSPKTPLKIIKDYKEIDKNLKAGLLAFKLPPEKIKDYVIAIEILSEKGDLKEAASNFFSALHKLDNLNLDIIYAEPVPQEGLGIAIMDRLKKAEKKFIKS